MAQPGIVLLEAISERLSLTNPSISYFFTSARLPYASTRQDEEEVPVKQNWVGVMQNLEGVKGSGGCRDIVVV